MSDPNLEKEIINQFIVPSKRGRLLGFAGSAKNRQKFLRALNTPSIFDERWITEFSGSDRSPDRLVYLYKTLGMGGRVYLVSEDTEWDGKKFQMSYIIDQCLAKGIDTLGYCWKTKTAFYEWHHSGYSYFMKRK